MRFDAPTPLGYPEKQSWDFYAGPIPSPAFLQGYDQIVPGSAKELLGQVIGETKHRHQWENRALEVSASERRRRDYMAVGVVLSIGLGLGAFLISKEAYWPAVVLGVLSVCGGGAVVLGRQLLMGHEKGKVEVVGDDGIPAPHTDGRSRKITAARKKASVTGTLSERQGRAGTESDQ